MKLRHLPEKAEEPDSYPVRYRPSLYWNARFLPGPNDFRAAEWSHRHLEASERNHNYVEPYITTIM